MSDEKFKQGDVVTWDCKAFKCLKNIKSGTICGIVNDLPITGKGYLVRMPRLISEVYPYDTVLMPEYFLTKKD